MEFCFYQRKESTNLFHAAIKQYENKPYDWIKFPKEKNHFTHQETYYNNNSLFSRLRSYIDNPLNMSATITIKDTQMLLKISVHHLNENITYVINHGINKEKTSMFNSKI